VPFVVNRFYPKILLALPELGASSIGRMPASADQFASEALPLVAANLGQTIDLVP
jgi:hypothetical protein